MLNQGDRVLKLYNRQYPFTKSLEFIWKVQIEVNFPSITIHFLKGQNKWQGSRDIFSWKGEQKFRHKMIKPLVWDDQTFRQPKWLSYHSSHSLLIIILLQTTISKNNQQKNPKTKKLLQQSRLKNSIKPLHCHLHPLHHHHWPRTSTSQTLLHPQLHSHLQPVQIGKQPNKSLIQYTNPQKNNKNKINF